MRVDPAKIKTVEDLTTALQQLYLASGLSFASIGKKAQPRGGPSSSTSFRIVNQGKFPSKEHLAVLVEVLGVPLGEAAGWTAAWESLSVRGADPRNRLIDKLEARLPPREEPLHLEVSIEAHGSGHRSVRISCPDRLAGYLPPKRTERTHVDIPLSDSATEQNVQSIASSLVEFLVEMGHPSSRKSEPRTRPMTARALARELNVDVETVYRLGNIRAGHNYSYFPPHRQISALEAAEIRRKRWEERRSSRRGG